MAVATSELLSANDRDLGERLVASGKVTRGDLERTIQIQRGTRERLDSLLVRSGLVSEQDAAQALAGQLSLPLAGPADYPDFPLLEEELSAKFLKHHKVVPLSCDDAQLVVAMADARDNYAVNALELVSARQVVPWVGLPSEIETALEHLYGAGKTQMARIVDDLAEASDETTSQEQIAQLRDLASEGPVIRLVNLLVEHAVEARASDIHVEPFEHKLRVRYRLDGMLQEVEAPPARLSAAVISRIKIMAKLDIAERRLPQDGRIRLRVRGSSVDLRVSTLPTMHGESVVMRLLYKDNATHDFRSLGFDEETLEIFLKTVRMPNGIVLVTGPTGSGKTTTLYAALTLLNDPARKIITVEDPIEYELAGINQIQVKAQIGLTFANTLRSIVRQDPDVIMIGEMRDLETAEIAVQSALTGHLVLSTLHTNDAAGSVTRMLDMGLKEYLVTSVLNGVLAQRLVRRLCPQCRRAYQPLPELIEQTRLDRQAAGKPIVLYEAVGCENCRDTGYQGRTTIMEMLVMSDRIRSLILQHADAREIARAAIADGMRTMYEDGLRKVLAGETTLSEVLRVTQET